MKEKRKDAGLSPRFVRQFVLAAAVVGCSAIQLQAGLVFDFPDFSNTTGLTLVGSANTPTTSDGTVLQLTPANYGQSGAAYSTTAVTLGGGVDAFSTTFQFRFTNAGGFVGSPADGITFVLAASPAGLGTSGGDIGYGGVPNSVAIEFDTYNNGSEDGNSSNHIAIDEDGNIINGTDESDQNLTNVYGVQTCDFGSGTYYTRPGCMSNGDLWTVTIGYDGTNLSVVAQDGSAAPFVAYSALPIDIASFLGTNTAYVGFTGGTGDGYEEQDVLNWSFANDTSLSSGTPEPGTLALLFGGIAGLAFAKRRRAQR